MGRRSSIAISWPPSEARLKPAISVPTSYGNAVVTDFWDEERKPEFERLWQETEAGPAWRT